MKKDSQWAKGGYTNLIRYKPTGMYYIRAKVAGKVIFDSLETTNQTFAKERLDARLKLEREAAREKAPDTDMSEWTVAQFVAEYALNELGETSPLRPATRKYKGELLKIIGEASFINSRASEVKQRDCIAWSRNGVSEYAPSRYNGLVDTLRAVFDLAIKSGARHDNPAKEVKKKPVVIHEPKILNKEQFHALLAELDTRKEGESESGRHWGRKLSKAGLLIRFLAYSGMRISEARQVTWDMIDRVDKVIRLPGTITKNKKPRHIPILSQMEPVLDQLKELCPDRICPIGERVLPIGTAKNVLKAALKKLGLPPMTHHTFRHLFTTYCLMQGVPVSTVAKWRGDSDGGAMMLKVYSHLIDSHSKEMAARVRF